VIFSQQQCARNSACSSHAARVAAVSRELLRSKYQRAADHHRCGSHLIAPPAPRDSQFALVDWWRATSIYNH
jgi:hypothetical protein